MLPFGTIQKIADDIDVLPDGWTSYLNRSTGEVYSLSDDDVFLIEDDLDDDSLPKWQLDELPKIREVLEGDAWVQLPSAFEVHEWSIMNDFSLLLPTRVYETNYSIPFTAKERFEILRRRLVDAELRNDGFSLRARHWNEL